MCELKKEFLDIILKHINLKCPSIRKPVYSNEYYLNNIIDLLNDFGSWRALRKSMYYKNEELNGKDRDEIKKDRHYKTIWENINNGVNCKFMNQHIKR